MRTVHMNFYEFTPGTEKGLVPGPRGLFEDVVHHAVSDPTRTSDNYGSKRGGGVGY